jgi:decaprenylphospho-beta-D-erythro-pentofuranosid-2-ulose 2-reductase
LSGAGTTRAGRRVLVLGGTSEIALAIVRELQSRLPRQVMLAGRDAAGLERAAEELRAAGCSPVYTGTIDALHTAEHAGEIAAAFDRLAGADIVILAVGVLGERGGLPSDIPAAVELLQANTVGAGSMLLHSADRLRRDGGGSIVVLSSVAAERPRRANAVYGASKAGLDSLAQGLGDELGEDGVRILVVRPGFVKTRMTEGLDPAPLATTPEGVARVTVQALDGVAPTVWAPAALRWVMLVLRLLPRPIFRRLKQ